VGGRGSSAVAVTAATATPTIFAGGVSQKFLALKEQLLEGNLANLGVPMETFVELCENMLKKCHDVRAERILDRMLEHTNFQQFAEMMEKRNVDLQVGCRCRCHTCCVLLTLSVYRVCVERAVSWLVEAS
jgi:hypothetical protein